MELFEEIESLKNKKDLVTFIFKLINDLKENKDEWENLSLEDYLSSINSWLEDTEDEFVEENIYSAIAKILYLGKIYE